jgi:hypothetical protein
MSIKVKHGEQDLSAIAALAVLLGAGQRKAPELPDLPNIPSGVVSGGGGGGRIRGLQGSAFDERTPATLTAPTQEQKIREAAHQEQLADQFGMPAQLEAMRAKAIEDAKNFETKFTVKQKQEMAGLNNARQSVMQSENFSPEQRQAALRAIDAKMAGITPSVIPSDKPKLPDWVNPIGVSVEPGTGIHGTMETRNGQMSFRPLPKELQPGWQETEYQKTQMDAQEKLMERRDKYEDTLRTTRIKKKTDDKLRGTSSESDEFLDEETIQRMLKARFQAPAQQVAPAPQPQAQAVPQGQGEWWGNLESTGVAVSEGEKQLPPQIGTASALYNAYRSKYGTYQRIPDELKPAYRETVKLLGEYYAKRP